MVAISLYRGNLHRVPDVTRRWLMPSQSISLKNFKSLLNKRQKTLSRINSNTAATSDEFVGDNTCSKDQINVKDEKLVEGNCGIEEERNELVDGDKDEVAEVEGVKEEKLPSSAVEISNNVDLPSDEEKKKNDLEQNLKVLNERKHNLVQMLKQQMAAATDLGSNPRPAVNRAGQEANFCGDLEGESEDVSNPNAHARHFHHRRSTSPSASSPLRKLSNTSLQHNAVPNNRPNLGATQTTSSMFAGVTSSPSRFAPSGYQGHPANLPPLSVSGNHFTASSPSPAASGGTSVCRDARLTSPSWN
ncbi:hypothetical protein IFM89_005749 [Coptis chinensis]|uniref:Uncharacterized protein n=1 Tax=Coptis chinensis TaxID=261450 RepID=A0A835M4T5_9MAGN|nr:hypothetical protein IFM89_005749 [Coptis chinensis]